MIRKNIPGRFGLSLLVTLLILNAGCSGDKQQAADPAIATGSEEVSPVTAVEQPVVQTGTGEEFLIYVTNEDSNDITVISGTDHSVLATIPVGKRPRGIKASPDGRWVYVALSGSPKCPPTMDDEECEDLEADKSADGIAKVDALTRELVEILPSGSDPEQFDVDWDAGRLYVSNEDSDMASILDLNSGELVASIPVGSEPEGVRLSPDKSIVYVTGETGGDITVLDAVDGSELARIQVGRRPRDSVFTSDGETAYVSAEHGFLIAVVDVASNSVIDTVELPERSLPMELELSLDEKTLYVANGRARTVAAIDLQTNQVIQTVDVGIRPWGLAMSPDGRYLYSANGPSNDVSVIDLETFEVIMKIPAGSSPWGVVTATVPSG